MKLKTKKCNSILNLIKKNIDSYSFKYIKSQEWKKLK